MNCEVYQESIYNSIKLLDVDSHIIILVKKKYGDVYVCEIDLGHLRQTRFFMWIFNVHYFASISFVWQNRVASSSESPHSSVLGMDNWFPLVSTYSLLLFVPSIHGQMMTFLHEPLDLLLYLVAVIYVLAFYVVILTPFIRFVSYNLPPWEWFLGMTFVWYTSLYIFSLSL